VPAGSYASGSPFNLIVIGPQWSEAELLAITFAYEQSTHHRKAPTLNRL
jgi:Asp-tRNA(Asn)/Glu-tRNA(Gln) amidotransferase A subunit family amidase